MTEEHEEEAGDDWVSEFQLIDETGEGERDCPVCGERMTMERKHGVTIEVCAEHGVWLDTGELEKIVQELHSKGRLRRRAAIRKREAEAASQAAIFGVIACL